ncbi:hypothetical protein RB623_21365 [Mesorhizobium sp. LHD-90]|uniref:hypothetical protein n=1 Tax=Mesorhizobium sp. LHD-90 TaxID=3071414 RepID=UPI0027E0B568|nr:hypothetical protein [Mesorhizobium sp. LHD-90]MDQ6436608.1 hypothetical protein [Mesorhizobium sp. LHD-90]
MADKTKDRTTDKTGRAARLAQELRANLARRKQQARSRDADGKAKTGSDAKAPDTQTEPEK